MLVRAANKMVWPRYLLHIKYISQKFTETCFTCLTALELIHVYKLEQKNVREVTIIKSYYIILKEENDIQTKVNLVPRMETNSVFGRTERNGRRGTYIT